MLGYALTLGTFEGWEIASAVWAARLTVPECGALAWAALRALEAEQAETIAQAVFGSAGRPLPALLAPLDDAQWWADQANPAERRAYCLATFMAMSKRDKRDFLAFAKGAAA